LNSISLFKDLARTGFHTSIVTTYSVDAAFYDGSLHHRLRAYGSDNNILMADANMLQRAITETPESFGRAGTAYALLPISVPGAFHPKISIRLGSDAGCVVVGSANATAAGWGRNREIVGRFEWWRKRSDGDEDANRQLIRKAFDYVSKWLGDAGLEAVKRKLDLIERDATWLFETEVNEGPVELSDGTLIDLLCEDASGGPGMLSRIVDLVGSASVTRLVVLSPYWDAKLEGLLGLIDALKPNETAIALSAPKPEFPVDQLQRIPQVSFAGVFDGNDGARFIHAKAFVIETEEWDHVIYGSANCSDDALGLADLAARNAECSVYRRLPAGSGLELLGLDLSSTIDRSDLMEPTKELLEAKPGAPLPLGTIEAAGSSLRWVPSKRITDPEGAALVIPEGEFAFSPVRSGNYALDLPVKPRFPLIARIRLNNGALTSAVIVNDAVSLTHAAPGLGDKRLRSAFAKVELEGGDFLELASLAAIIFSETPESRRKAAKAVKSIGRTHGKGTEGEDEHVVYDYDSPEAFREAMSASAPSKGDSSRLNFDDPDAVNLLRIILRGIGQADNEDDALYRDEVPEGGDGNDEGDGNTNSDPPGDQDNGGGQDAPPREPRTYRRDEAERQSLDILKAVDCFEAYIARLVADETPPPRKLTAEVCFILRLMVEACRRPLVVKEGDKKDELFALDLVPKQHDRDRAFAVRVGRILQRLWQGNKSEPSLLSRISIGQHQTEMPFDCFALVALTRWALARSVMAMTSSKQAELAGFVTKGAIAIWKATQAWPRLDPEAELEFVGKLDAALGIKADETDNLLRHYVELNQQLESR
jgi:hypothetical protein